MREPTIRGQKYELPDVLLGFQEDMCTHLISGKRGLSGFSGEWRRFTLKEIATLQAGINKPVSQMGRGALYVTVQDLYSGTSICTEKLGRIQVTAEELASRSLKPGDIVLGKSSVKREGIGYPSMFLGCAEPVVFSGFTFCARPHSGLVNPVFLFYVLRSEKMRRWLIENSQASALTNINREIAERIPVLLPELDEQTSIAATLSDADALISSLEKLIAKKRDIKKGAIQLLLSGKERLPGFNREWEPRKLGEIVEILKGRGLSKEQLNPSGKNKCVLYGELFTTYKQVIRRVVSRTHSSEGRLSRCGDILMPGSTTTVGIDLAIASALLEADVSLGGDIIVLRKKDNRHNPEFLAYHLTETRKHAISGLAQGITIVHLRGRDLADLGVMLPPTVEEQENIAAVILDMDEEVASLEHKLEKYRLIKQGMMQELLTGKKRLICGN